MKTTIENRDGAMRVLEQIASKNIPPVYLDETLASFLLACFRRDLERMIELEGAQQDILNTIEATRGSNR